MPNLIGVCHVFVMDCSQIVMSLTWTLPKSAVNSDSAVCVMGFDPVATRYTRKVQQVASTVELRGLWQEFNSGG